MNEALRTYSTRLGKRFAEVWGGKKQKEGRGEERKRRDTESEVTGASWQKEVKGTQLASHHRLIQCVRAAQHMVVSAIPTACSLTHTAAVPWPHTQTSPCRVGMKNQGFDHLRRC